MYQSTQVRLVVDGLDMTQLLHLDTAGFETSDPNVVQVHGTTVSGVGTGTASISVGQWSTHVTVQEEVFPPTLVPFVVTSVPSVGVHDQTFDSEDDVGYMYVYAEYANGDKHMLLNSEVLVTTLVPSKVAYTLSANGRHTISVTPSASSTLPGENVVEVTLSACSLTFPGVSPQIVLDLPSPDHASVPVLSEQVIAPVGSFAASGLLTRLSLIVVLFSTQC